MTRLELLSLVIARARSNGFEFRRWYTNRLGLPWISPDAALALLDAQRRYYALVFSHEFAQAFWKAGAEITFDVPPQSFQRTMPDGTTGTVQRKSYIRRSSRPNAWKYHLREMALADEPLRYLRRYLHIEDELTPATPEGAGGPADARLTPPPRAAAKKRAARPVPTDVPGFLQKPYRPR